MRRWLMEISLINQCMELSCSFIFLIGFPLGFCPTYLIQSCHYSRRLNSTVSSFIFTFHWEYWIIMGLKTSNNFLHLIAVLDTSAKLWEGTTERDNLVQDYLEKMNESNLDLIIFPASLVPAPKKVRYIFGCCIEWRKAIN